MTIKKLVLGLVACILLASLSSAGTILVPDDYPTIQAAINAAVNGDEIIVRPGAYFENIDFFEKAIIVKSFEGPDVTIIDGNQAGSVVTFSGNTPGGPGDPDAAIQGFTITNGRGTPEYPSDPNTLYYGGGVFCQDDNDQYNRSEIAITGNIITANDASFGGGIYYVRKRYNNDWWRPSVTVQDNSIISNFATLGGGGIYCLGADSFAALDNEIQGNTAVSGGGLLMKSELEGGMSYPGWRVEGNLITGNTAAFGSGIYCYDIAPKILCNRIADNVCSSANNPGSSGGGILCYSRNIISWNKPIPKIGGNIIEGNSAESSGGGAYFAGCFPKIYNNLLADNQSNDAGGGICIIGPNPIGQDDPEPAFSVITSNTLFRNTSNADGGGIFCTWNSKLKISNTILYDNLAPNGTELWIGNFYNPSTAEIAYSDLKGGIASVHVEDRCIVSWDITSIIDADPAFIDPSHPSYPDFHLTWNSPCKDSGDMSALGLPSEDLEGDPRTVNNETDIGADEYNYHLYCDQDPVSAGTLVKFTVIGIPAESVRLYYDDDGDQLPDGHFDLNPVNQYGYTTFSFTVPMGLQDQEILWQARLGSSPNFVWTNIWVMHVL